MTEQEVETRPTRLTAWLPTWLLNTVRLEAKRRGLTITALVINGLYKELEIPSTNSNQTHN